MGWQPSTEITLLLALWLAGHLCLFLTLGNNYKNAALILMLVLLGAIYCIKPATMDLQNYSIYFNTGDIPGRISNLTHTSFIADVLGFDNLTQLPYFKRFPDSIGFAWIMSITASVLPHGPFLPRLGVMTDEYVSDSMVLVVFMLGLVIFFSATWNLLVNQLRSAKRFELVIVSITITLGSIFFFIGSQNSVRQFLMLCFCMLALSFAARRHFILALGITFISISIHQWGWAFIGLAIVLLVLQGCSTRQGEIRALIPLKNELYAFGFGLILVTVLTILHSIGNPELIYLLSLADSEEPFRTSLIVKISLLSSLFLISEIIAGSTCINSQIDIRGLRRTTFLLILPLALYSEIFSRVYFFYFAVEALFIVWTLVQPQKRVQLSGIVIFGCYSIAPNALNILLGKGWQEFAFF